MSKAQLVITAVVLEGRSKSEVARDYDVSRQWVEQLCKRYDAEGAAAYIARSRRPHRNPRAVSAEVEEHIVRLRKTLTKRGLDAGAETIAAHLVTDPTIINVWTESAWPAVCRSCDCPPIRLRYETVSGIVASFCIATANCSHAIANASSGLGYLSLQPLTRESVNSNILNAVLSVVLIWYSHTSICTLSEIASTRLFTC
jgi:hypothetical protein